MCAKYSITLETLHAETQYLDRRANMKDFNYEPIDLKKPTFRLVQLRSGDGDIECEIFGAGLDQQNDGVSYEALSYAWGVVDMTDNIRMNGRRLGVTNNLYTALRYLRFQDKDRILWIDAICIDQANEREKQHQVQQMGKIYSQAEGVIFWSTLR